jgi:hypothetical protein
MAWNISTSSLRERTSEASSLSHGSRGLTSIDVILGGGSDTNVDRRAGVGAEKISARNGDRSVGSGGSVVALW